MLRMFCYNPEVDSQRSEFDTVNGKKKHADKARSFLQVLFSGAWS